MPEPQTPLDLLPPPRVIHARMGELYRELTLLRRLLRLARAAAGTPEDGRRQPDGREARHAR